MIPLSDDNPVRRSVPIMTYVLIALNFLFFFVELAGGEDFVKEWAFVPSRFISHPMSNVPTIFTSMFMHAGWAHILGNMLYLWIFGPNVEDRFGKLPYLAFYLMCGIAATFAQLLFTTDSSVPNLGASGAIAGVLGGYIVLFPQERINVLIGQSVAKLPALIVIGLWFVIQFLSSMGAFSSSDDSGGGGVAYMAHVGGFILGLIIALMYKARQAI